MFTNNFYKLYYSLNTAATLKACEKEVSIFFSGYSCNFIKKDWNTDRVNEINNKILSLGMESYESLLNLCKDLNISFFYCSSAFLFMDLKKEDIIPTINIKSEGLYTIINDYKNDQIIFI